MNAGSRKSIKVGVLAANSGPGATGGAERFYDGLLGGLRSLGCDAELVWVPAEEPNFEAIVSNYSHCQQLDLDDYDVVISTKAPTYAIRHRRHVVYLVHTVRAFDDMFDDVFPSATEVHRRQRANLHALDHAALSAAKACFAIGYEVAERLRRWRGLDANVIHPPLGVTGLTCGPQGDYFFLPGRLHAWKRVHLVVQAVLSSALPLKLLIAGTGEEESALKQLAAGDPRVQFLGRVSDVELAQYYANCLAVPFTPQREDYGYVTLEAFASGKPVVTCTDSGEPTRFVRSGVNGWVVSPDVGEIRAALERLHTDRIEAARMGDNGNEWVKSMSWPVVAAQLVEAALQEEPAPQPKALKVTVVDMQPIDPPIGGGRLRLLGLYHALGEDIACTYIGSYDWPGELYRQHHLSSGLEEIDVPLSPEHHAAAGQLAASAGLPTVIDIAFSRFVHLSPEYLSVARQAIGAADVVVFSHPWAYQPLQAALLPHQTVVYDSQNVEGFLRGQLLDESIPAQADLLRHVVNDELQLCRRADLVLACSQDDLNRFNRVYRVPAERLRVVPNGVMAFAQPLPDLSAKLLLKAQTTQHPDRLVALFIGSAYGPNIDAAHFIADELAAALPDVLWVIAGGVGAHVSSKRENVHVTGPISDADRSRWLQVADIAVNPMFSGSGTNIKMFDFMGAGLPTVTTEVGARGIETGGRNAFSVVAPNTEAFIHAISDLLRPEARQVMGQAARLCVEEGYAWERISRHTGDLFRARHSLGRQPAPMFSVVVPTYERHSQLDELMTDLAAQVERDFEVVVVDQSRLPWVGARQHHGFHLTYCHTPVKGAVRARNTGASLAQGRILAFTDDDCRPSPDWLLNARKYFSDDSTVGLEGLIRSDHLDDPDWRPVTNLGFEGVGFMTANLMVRSGCLRWLGGFDLQFDHPHFREDTDFGWRLQRIGCVPYAPDVEVFHPAQPRATERESLEVRSRYFEKDALLCSKHPEAYEQLFYRESQFNTNPYFVANLCAGFAKYKKTMPLWLKEFLNKTKD